MDRTGELHYLISGNNQFVRVNLSRAAAGAAVKKAKELLLLSDEFDQLEG